MKRSSVLFVGFLILATACAPASGQHTTKAVPSQTSPAIVLTDEQVVSEATLTPTPTTMVTAIMLLPEQWFSEHFDGGMPANWIASPGWTSGTSSVLTTQLEQTFYIPVEWTDLEIHARFQRNPEGWSSIGFRNRGDNYYQFSFDRGNFILGRHDAEQYNGHILVGQKLTVGTGWHDLVIRAVGGQITITWDGQTIIQFTDQNPLVSGDIFVQNWDNTLYELDLLEVSSPAETAASAGGDLGNPTPRGPSISSGDGQQPIVTPITPAPPPGTGGGRPTEGSGNNAVDLAVNGGYFDARGNLWASLSNGGPAAYTGNIELSCTIWYDMTPMPLGIGGSDSHSVILEPGQGIDIQTGCKLDESLGNYMGANLVIADYPIDPNTANNYINLSP